jgi:hypothetical protein
MPPAGVEDVVNACVKDAERYDGEGEQQEAANLAAAFVLEWSCDGDGRLFR